MKKSGYSARLLGLSLLLGLGFAGLGARLVDVQVLKHEHFSKIKDSNTLRAYLREARRGDILDARGNPLATCLPVKRVLADPSFLGEYSTEVANAVAPLLGYTEAQLAQMLRPTWMTNREGKAKIRSYVDLHRKVSVDQWQQVTQSIARLNFGLDFSTLTRTQRQFFRGLRQNGIYAKDAQLRFYPNKALAAHVLGYTQEREEMLNGMVVHELTGEYGVEKQLHDQLAGVCGWRITETDNRRREITVYRNQDFEPRPGLNAVLTIDLVIQNIVEQELAEAMKKFSPVSVQALVVRPRTGEILALATLPNFDPNDPGSARMEHLRNRVIADMIEPGSTFKVVVVAAGLNENLINLSDTFDCERGNWRYGGRVLHDAHSGYGILSVEEIIAKSSNIGAAKIAVERVSKERLYKYIRNFGFGSRTEIPLPGEVNGWVHPLPYWERDKVMITRVPIGQSITVTPLQMAMAYSALANGGKLMRPMLVQRLQDGSGQVFAQYEPITVRRVISEQAAREVTAAMKKVTMKGGTAEKAALEHYTVAGKTGTAWKTENGRYAEHKYVSSFIGYFPADAPEVCITVVMDEPNVKVGYYGGTTTAPIFQKIAEQIARYLQIRPDRETEEVMAGMAGANRLPSPTLGQN